MHLKASSVLRLLRTPRRSRQAGRLARRRAAPSRARSPPPRRRALRPRHRRRHTPSAVTTTSAATVADEDFVRVCSYVGRPLEHSDERPLSTVLGFAHKRFSLFQAGSRRETSLDSISAKGTPCLDATHGVRRPSSWPRPRSSRLGKSCGTAWRRPEAAQVATLRHSTRRIGTARHSKLSSITRYSPSSTSMPTILPNRPSLELERW